MTKLFSRISICWNILKIHSLDSITMWGFRSQCPRNSWSIFWYFASLLSQFCIFPLTESVSVRMISYVLVLFLISSNLLTFLLLKSYTIILPIQRNVLVYLTAFIIQSCNCFNSLIVSQQLPQSGIHKFVPCREAGIKYSSIPIKVFVN